MQNSQKKARKTKKCGVITCIHCTSNICMNDKCDFYERFFQQED